MLGWWVGVCAGVSTLFDLTRNLLIHFFKKKLHIRQDNRVSYGVFDKCLERSKCKIFDVEYVML